MKEYVFSVNDWKEEFEKRKFSVPTNEEDFRRILEGRFPMRLMTDEIKKATLLTLEDIDSDYPSRKERIDKFFEVCAMKYADPPVESIEKAPSSTITEHEHTRIVVDDEDSMSLTEAQSYLNSNRSRLTKSTDGEIRVKSPDYLYENRPITVHSNFVINIANDLTVSRNNVLILDDEREHVLAIGRVVDKEGKNLLVAQCADIEYGKFFEKTKFHIALLKTHKYQMTGEIIYSSIAIHIKHVEETDRVLCIDFGTSNTTAGSYQILDEDDCEPELVTFADVTKNNVLVDYYPTVVYVENCSDEYNITYKFGFEAKAEEMTHNYESSASVFYQIKHWLIEDSNYNKMVEVCDPCGNTAIVRKNDVVKAYLQNVIELSEIHFNVKFKELHFTAPVKMKDKFISTLSELFTDYVVLKSGIDESGAIIFDYVLDKFYDWSNHDNQNENSKGNVAVIDCGGGTTDLASCDYSFKEDEEASGVSIVEVNTQFTNGDFDFGGNNITYRIMQLIKLKIALLNGFISDDEFNKALEKNENAILDVADTSDYNEDTMYSELNDLYDKCEDFLPTRFGAMSKDLYDDDMPKIKRNFFYLWQFADQVKIIFYREEKEVKKDQWDDAIEAIGDLQHGYLYKKDRDKLVKLDSPLSSLVITITEIRKVIFGDIYCLLNRTLNTNESGIPDPIYDYYRLSGQSCKINLFNELLKEFIPGKKLRAKMENNGEMIKSISLKKRCIYGSIKYVMHNRLSMQLKVITRNTCAKQIYHVFFAGIGSENYPTIYDNKLVMTTLRKNLRELSVIVENEYGKKIRKFKFIPVVDLTNEPMLKSASDVINEIKKKSEQDGIDWETAIQRLSEQRPENGKNGDLRWITAVQSGNGNGYGFNIFIIFKVVRDQEEKYKISSGKYYNYESTNTGFFDGKR